MNISWDELRTLLEKLSRDEEEQKRLASKLHWRILELDAEPLERAELSVAFFFATILIESGYMNPEPDLNHVASTG